MAAGGLVGVGAGTAHGMVDGAEDGMPAGAVGMAAVGDGADGTIPGTPVGMVPDGDGVAGMAEVLLAAGQIMAPEQPT